MFTGIVEAIGRVEAFELRGDGGACLTLCLTEPWVNQLVIGESLALNGCCLSVVEREGEQIYFDLLEETLEKTNLGALTVGAKVNVERAMPADGRFSGHVVQGHVDARCKVMAWEQRGADYFLEIALPRLARAWVVPKGSIAINGISLTIAQCGEVSVAMWIIPHTYRVTNLAELQVGAAVNVEYDILGKYVARQVNLLNESSPS